MAVPLASGHFCIGFLGIVLLLTGVPKPVNWFHPVFGRKGVLLDVLLAADLVRCFEPQDDLTEKGIPTTETGLKYWN